MEGGQSPLPAQAPVPAPPAPAAVRRQDRQLLPPAAGGLSDLTPPRAAPLRRRVDPAQQAGRAATTNSSSSSSSSTTTTTTVPEPVRAPVDNLRHASQSLAGVGEDPLDESLADTSPTATSHLKRPGPPVDAGPQLPGPTTAAPRPAGPALPRREPKGRWKRMEGSAVPLSCDCVRGSHQRQFHGPTRAGAHTRRGIARSIIDWPTTKRDTRAFRLAGDGHQRVPHHASRT